MPHPAGAAAPAQSRRAAAERPSLKKRLFCSLPERTRERIRSRLLPLEALRLALGGEVEKSYANSRAQQFFFDAFRALRYNRIDGDYLEFGSWSGFTFRMAYHQARRAGHRCHLWSFDSFQGLPPKQCAEDDHPKWRTGDMAMSVEEFHDVCRYYGVPRSAYTVTPGFCQDSLFDPSVPKPANVALAYIDCDMYSSTRTVLEFLLPIVKHGTVLAFDDWHCWSGTQPSGERRACYEAFANHPEWRLIPFRWVHWGAFAFVLESKRLAAGMPVPPDWL